MAAKFHLESGAHDACTSHAFLNGSGIAGGWFCPLSQRTGGFGRDWFVGADHGCLETRTHSRRSEPRVLTGASCASRGGHCLAVGDLCPRKFCGAWEPGRNLVTSTLGRHWTVRAHPASVGSLQTVACPTASECIVTEIRKASATRTGAILRTANAGRSWSMTVLRRAAALAGLSCPSAKECYAVGSSPTGGRSMLISTKNGGRTWKRKVLTAGLTSITCASPVRCVALGFGLIMSTTDGGAH